jgi:hypothetical protein
MHRETIPERPWPQRVDHDHFIFEGMTFPATREDLVSFATDAELDRNTLNLVRSLPDRTFESTTDIWRSIGEGTRVMLGGEGSPRDDIGKEAVLNGEGMLHP